MGFLRGKHYSMNILLTGGAGYIGSHTAVSLLEHGHSVVLYDNLVNSNISVVGQINKITGKNIPFVHGDVRDIDSIIHTLKLYQIDAVVHFAGLKAVGESVINPIDYFSCNIQGTISLLQSMRELKIKNLIFSSSATVYGSPQYLPIDENHPTKAVNPYGLSKLHIEEMLADVAKSDSKWRIVCLRYFNPVGAHESGLIGENPNGIPNNLMPIISQVAAGKMAELTVFWGNYSTKDGTGVRDYIHVMDVAEGHLAALNYSNYTKLGWSAFNLGTGKGCSVLEMVKAFEIASGKLVPYKIVDRRPGDVAICYAKVDKAQEELQWFAKRDLAEMCASAWRFQDNAVCGNF